MAIEKIENKDLKNISGGTVTTKETYNVEVFYGKTPFKIEGIEKKELAEAFDKEWATLTMVQQKSLFKNYKYAIEYGLNDADENMNPKDSVKEIIQNCLTAVG